MPFEWLKMRITEEDDRRRTDAETLQRLPQVMDEVHLALADCLEAYAAAFGKESVELSYILRKLRITVRELKEGKWEKSGKIEVTTIPKPPSLHIDRNGDVFDIELGLLGEDKIYYRDGDKFLTMEELTRRILDRALFPKLGAET